jgi:hypothetical protein
MITNERQYRITKSQLSRLEEALRGFDIAEVKKRVGSDVLANAESDAIRSEIEILSSQLYEYEN